jgi:carboxyl-terminal processing protease
LLLAALLTGNLVVGARLYTQEAADTERDAAYDKIALFTKVLEQVRANYVDKDKTSYGDLVNGALRGMLQSLDPHSQFLDPDMYSDMKDDTSGQFGGLGIVISIKDSVLTIVAPMEDTPGYRAGLLPGDKIMEIDGRSTEGLTLPEAVRKLRGEPGTKVTIKILRVKSQELKVIELERAKIEMNSVKDARIIEDGIGYIRVTQFNEPTANALQTSLEQLMTNDLQALILDLRNNPGGLLSSAIEVSQKFLKRNAAIVSTQGRDEKQKQTFRSKGRRRHYVDFPMVVLVNAGSASASEIVAGALKDHKRAILIGEKTFGKGSVQSVLPMDGGTAIRLTTAKYYTPENRMIHDRGIEPDIVVPMPPEDWRKLMIKMSRPKNAELEPGEENVDDVVDIQLQRAIDVLKGIMTFTSHQRPELMVSKTSE